MRQETGSGIWTLLEISQGKIAEASLELLTAACMLSERSGEAVCAVMIGNNITDAVEMVKHYNIQTIYSVQGKAYEVYGTDAFTSVLQGLICKYNPSVLLMSSSTFGKDLAPRVAARMGAGLVADCTSLDYDLNTRKVIFTRPAYSGNLMANIQCQNSTLQMGTIRPGVFEKPRLCKEARVSWKEENEIAKETPEQNRIQVLQEIVDTAGKNIIHSREKSIIAVGRGAATVEGLDLACNLADILGAGIGASRALVETRMLSEQYQIGQTGRNVRPDLYIACGISGTAQHLAGISGAKCIVAVNSDPHAPIFRYADYGICGDLYTILPEMIRQLEDR